MNIPDDYTEWDEFDPHEYAWRNYGRQILEVDRWTIEGVVKWLLQHGITPESLEKMVDIGTGPNLFPAMLLAPFIRPRKNGGTIELIDCSAPNRAYLKSVITPPHDDSPMANIWEKYETLMTSYSSLWRNSLSMVRNLATVKDGDVYKLPKNAYDAATAFFVAESITDSREESEKAIDAVIASVKPGGLVIIDHMLKSEGWHAGQHTHFPAVPLSIEDLQEIYKDRLESFKIIMSPLSGTIRKDDHGTAAVIGLKPLTSAPTAKTIDNITEKAFTYYDTQACLYDTERVAHLKHAIFSTVKPGDIVVDAGSGTGLLGMLAAQAGAAKVYCVELNAECAKIIDENAKRNGMQDKIITVCADATTTDLPEEVDVIVSEVISAGFFYEPQLQIMTNLKRFLKPGGRTIPEVINSYIELIDAQDELYGLRMDYDARYYALNDTSLTTRSRYLSTDFSDDTPHFIDAQTTVRCLTPGRANAVKITYDIRFSESTIATQATEFLLIPQMIFLQEPLWLQSGDYYDIGIAYEASSAPTTSRIEIRPQKAVSSSR